MNARTRFRETLRFGRPDRVPFCDHEIRDYAHYRELIGKLATGT